MTDIITATITVTPEPGASVRADAWRTDAHGDVWVRVIPADRADATTRDGEPWVDADGWGWVGDTREAREAGVPV